MDGKFQEIYPAENSDDDKGKTTVAAVDSRIEAQVGQSFEPGRQRLFFGLVLGLGAVILADGCHRTGGVHQHDHVVGCFYQHFLGDDFLFDVFGRDDFGGGGPPAHAKQHCRGQQNGI